MASPATQHGSTADPSAAFRSSRSPSVMPSAPRTGRPASCTGVAAARPAPSSTSSPSPSPLPNRLPRPVPLPPPPRPPTMPTRPSRSAAREQGKLTEHWEMVVSALPFGSFLALGWRSAEQQREGLEIHPLPHLLQRQGRGGPLPPSTARLPGCAHHPFAPHRLAHTSAPGRRRRG
uniref:Uncharacterized protein n=1 Tax=Setaria italica TaxID=4555 RepID=K4A370_SETIT